MDMESPIAGLSEVDRTRFYFGWISSPPGRLYVQQLAGCEMVCKPVTESTHFETARRVLAGEDIASTEYASALDQWATPQEFSTLIESMRTKGYDPDPERRITVAINARGQLVILDGLHRAATALALGLDSVPLTVLYRAEEWQTLRLLLVSINKRLGLYQPIDHPDLAWPVHRTDTAARVELIHEALIGQGARAGVDLACHTGALTFGLASKGLSVLGLDTDPDTVRVADMLRGIDGVGHDHAAFGLTSPVLSLPPWACGLRDFVVCFSLLNHHWADPGRLAEGAEIFRACVRTAPLIFLDAPAPGDEIGGDSEFTDPSNVFVWCGQIDPGGEGRIVALRGTRGLQRDLLVWRRS